jgi:hypothetical protein
MSDLEVLQMFPSYRNAFLSVLESLDPCGSNIIKFDVTDVKPCLPFHVASEIHVEYMKFTIKGTVIYEGASTSVMSLSYWKSIGSPPPSQSMTMLTTFDGNYFKTHVILPSFPFQLVGKTVEDEVKVVDVPLNYNLLIGHNWTYSIIVIVSSIFHTLCFP